jgi:hypothetical protein
VAHEECKLCSPFKVIQAQAPDVNIHVQDAKRSSSTVLAAGGAASGRRREEIPASKLELDEGDSLPGKGLHQVGSESTSRAKGTSASGEDIILLLLKKFHEFG